VGDATGCCAGGRLVLTAGLRVTLLVCGGSGDDRGGREALVVGVGGTVTEVLTDDVVGVGVGEDEDEVADVLGVGVGLDELLLGVDGGAADVVAAFGEVISWWVAIRSRGLPARKPSMKLFQVRPGMSLP
jgi:hypothetical protein